jgi:signal transduction histidine kinase
MATVRTSAVLSRWELAAETIAIKMRWFGLLVGYVLIMAADPAQRPVLHAILALGAVYALFDTYQSLRGRVFLGHRPLLVSAMEALFIGLLCYFHGGLESSFRYYYILSLICCAVRYPSKVTYATFALHSASYTLLFLALPEEQRRVWPFLLTLVVLGWVTWAGDALALLLKRVGEHLGRLNTDLREHQTQLEERIAERTRQLQEAQAHVLHQEKMAAFGLLAAGIAHEVGNPLTAISSLVQMLQRRDCDGYTADKLALVNGQLRRIQGTLRELINFSRPASTQRTQFTLGEILDEALHIAKYYKRIKGRVIETAVPPGLPPLAGVRDQLVQVFLNLILNAIDATSHGGKIVLHAERHGDTVAATVCDDGHGIGPEQAGRIFEPYFTTKPHGTGLGLFVTRQLVRDHGGEVEFRSRPGEGTTFTVRLPVVAPAGDSQPCLQRAVPQPS